MKYADTRCPAHWISFYTWWWGIVLALLILPMAAHAQYVVGPSVLAGGGARMSGGGYVVTATSGQSGPIGMSTGGSYMTHHGFWYAVTGGGGALSPMLLAITQLNPTAARLSWGAVAGATFYDLYRSTTPFFNASGSPWRTVSAPATSSDFAAGIGDIATNYFFRGIARNATQTSSQSNTVGEEDYDWDTLYEASSRSCPSDGTEQ